MYKLLIVDDEAWIRERLRSTIDWKRMGIEIVEEAGDGEEALEITGRILPDIVITDIRMPCIDGLEYIKRLRAWNNSVKVVIISGYSDFEYAQKAIKYGACDYILKPIEDEELIRVISKCLEELESENKKKNLFMKAKVQIEESRPLLKTKFFINLINGYFDTEDEIAEEFGYWEIACCKRKNICFIIEIDGLNPSSKDIPVSDKNLIQFVLCNIVEEFLNKLGSGESFFLQPGEIIGLVFSDTDEEMLAHQVLSVSNGIKKMMKRITGYSVTIGVGRAYGTLLEISASYREAREALKYKAYLGIDRIYDIRSIDTQHRPAYYKANDLEILLNNIKIGNKEGALAALDGMIKGVLKRNVSVYPIDLKLIYIDIINSIFKIFLDTCTSFDDFPEFSFRFFEQLNMLQTTDEICQWLADTVVKIIDVMEKYKTSKKRKVIEKAVEYINSHYTEQITLNSISERFYMNASYFCKIFKEEMGESFTKYFINLRVQRAKELLTDPTRKIYEIARQVGYDDVQYFTKTFKSIQGVTPLQFREKIN